MPAQIKRRINLLTPFEALEEFEELKKKTITEKDLGRLLTIGILKGKRTGRKCFIERYSIVRMIQLMNNITIQEIINYKPGEPVGMVAYLLEKGVL